MSKNIWETGKGAYRDSFDFNDSLPMDGEGTMPKKFTEMYPNWKKDPRGMYEMFREYAEKVMGT